MHMCGSRWLTGCALATLSVLALIRHVENASAELWKRGGNVLTTEEAYEMFNKWVVHLRRPDPPAEIPAYRPSTSASNFDYGMDYMSLGYGLYFRRPGFMLVDIQNVLSGVKKSNSGPMMLMGHYVNRLARNRLEPRANQSAPITYKPHLLTDIKHVYTIAGASLGVIRVSMVGFKDVFIPANGKLRYVRYLDFPELDSLPNIAKLTDQRDLCWVVIHNYFLGDKMGYNQYEWRYWPVKKKRCKGPICELDPVVPWDVTDRYEKLEDKLNRPGRICENMQDKGAPIMCHTEKRSMRENGTATVSDKQWKLGYWAMSPFGLKKSRRDLFCDSNFYAVDLAYLRETLFDPNWEQFFEGGAW